MNILYFGSVCDEEWFTKISAKTAIPSMVAQYMFEKALVDGFSSINNLNMKIYYLFQEPYYPKGTYLRFKKRRKQLNSRLTVNYLARINLPFIKELYSFFQGFIQTTKWAIKNLKKKEKVILTPYNYTPLSLGILIASKLFGIKRINIFTDLSSDIINSERQKDMVWFKKLILPFYKNLVNLVELNYDGYILFTQPMKNKVNPNDRPYLVIEGIYQSNLDLSEVPKNKAIMYAGTLAFEYGVKNITDAFEQINDPDLQLWLFGDGDMRTYIENLSVRDKRVKYFGFKSRSEVFEYEKRATMLINARNPNDKYTKYSFPSKTFEYMVSGTPFLTTELDCIPDEYYEYLHIINNSDVLSIKKGIEEVLKTPKEKLYDFGKNARTFILENKNNSVQCEKIFNFLSTLLNE
jgi:hypothetical protein